MVTNYYNSKGEKTTKEKFVAEQGQFLQHREEQYQKKLNEIKSQIPNDITEKEKAAFLYHYLVNYLNYDYEVLERIDEQGNAGPVSHLFWNKWGLASHEKYAPIILGRGSCYGIASAFYDLCLVLNINCQMIEGLTKEIPSKKVFLRHTWNVVEVDGELGHVDVTYGVLYRDKGFDKENFFFLDNNQLKDKGPHHNFDENKVAKSYRLR